MERDSQIAHGNSSFLTERLFLVSDPFQISICNNCGIMVNNLKSCQSCNRNDISNCNFPYASKLLHQELTAIGLKLKIKSEEK